MKHLKVFEKFESKKLSKIFAYITKTERPRFLQQIKTFCEALNYPISELSDDKFKYMRFTEAFNLKDNKGEKNIKFWFSLDGRYIGTTKYKLAPTNSEDLQEYDIDRSRNYVNSYIELDHLQKVSIMIDGMECLGVIWKGLSVYGKESVFVIQNRHSGDRPDGSEWRNYGSRSWKLGGSDYKSIYKVTKKSGGVDARPPEEFNESCDIQLRRTGGNIKDFLKDADFALVLDYNLLYQKSPKNGLLATRDSRRDRKYNVLVNKKDAEIKKENINRYLNKLSKYDPSLGIDQSKKIVPRLYGWDHPLYFIWWGNSDDTFISIISYIYELVKGDIVPIETKNTYLKRISDYLKSAYENCLGRYLSIQKNIKYCKDRAKKEGNQDKMDFLDKYDSLNKSIKDYMLRGSVETISDLEVIYGKIKMIKILMKESRHRFVSYLDTFIDYLGSDSDSNNAYDRIPTNKALLKAIDDTIRSISRL